MSPPSAATPPAAISKDAVRARVSESDRLMAQRLLAVLGRLGASVHEALVTRVGPGIVGNVDVLVLATLDVEGKLRPTHRAAKTEHW